MLGILSSLFLVHFIDLGNFGIVFNILFILFFIDLVDFRNLAVVFNVFFILHFINFTNLGDILRMYFNGFFIFRYLISHTLLLLESAFLLTQKSDNANQFISCALR